MNETGRSRARRGPGRWTRAQSPGGSLITGLLATGLAMLLPTLAAASAAVYHSPGDDGDPAQGAVEMASGDTQTLYLYIYKGDTSSGGGECDVGLGDEICAYDVEVTIDGDPTINTWIAHDSSVVGSPAPDGKSIRINRIVVSPEATPIRIGELQVDVLGNAGRIDVQGRHIINASQNLEAVSNGNLAFVPEPGQLLMLASGVIGLGALAALRRRR